MKKLYMLLEKHTHIFFISVLFSPLFLTKYGDSLFIIISGKKEKNVSTDFYFLQTIFLNNSNK